MKRLLSFLTSLIVGLVIFLVVMAKVGLHNIQEAFVLFLGPSGLIMLSFALVFLLLGVLKWQIILKGLGCNLPFKQLAPFWLTGFSISFLTPFAMFGGEFFRIYFVKKNISQIPYQKNLASVAIEKLVQGTVFFFYLISGLLVFVFYGRLPQTFGGLAVLISAGFFLFLLAFFYIKRLRRESILEWLIKFVGLRKERLANNHHSSSMLKAEQEVFHFFSLKNKVLWQAFALDFGRYFIHILASIVLIFFLTNQFAPLKSLASYGFTGASSLTPLPAMLGAFELGAGFAFSALGFGFQKGTLFSIIWRNAFLIYALLGLLFLAKFSAKAAEHKIYKLFSGNNKCK